MSPLLLKTKTTHHASPSIWICGVICSRHRIELERRLQGFSVDRDRPRFDHADHEPASRIPAGIVPGMVRSALNYGIPGRESDRFSSIEYEFQRAGQDDAVVRRKCAMHGRRKSWTQLRHPEDRAAVERHAHVPLSAFNVAVGVVRRHFRGTPDHGATRVGGEPLLDGCFVRGKYDGLTHLVMLRDYSADALGHRFLAVQR